MGGDSSKPEPPPVYHCSTCGATNSSNYCSNCYQIKLQRENEDRQRAHAKEQAAAKEKQLAAERAHAEKLKQMEMAAAESARKDAKEERESKIATIDASILECEKEIEKFGKNIEEREKKISELVSKQESLKGDLKTLDEKYRKKQEEGESDKALKRKELKVDEYFAEFELCNKQIKSAIDRTCVSETNIGKFLVLTQYLTQATLNNQAEIDRLSSIMDTFSTLIQREGSGDLSIDYYFGTKNMEKFAVLLANEELFNMEDIMCDTPEDYDELHGMILNQLELEKEKWQEMTDDEKTKSGQLKEPKAVLKFNEKNFLKRACMQPETWQKFAKEKQETLKERLTASSPVYCSFFERIFEAMEQAQAMLTYNDDLNDQQRKAIEMAKQDHSNKNKNNNNNNNMKAIEVGSGLADEDSKNNNNNGDTIEEHNNNDENKESKENKENQESSEDDKEEDEEAAKEKLMKLMKGMDDNSKAKVENSLALRECAIKSINVVSSLEKEISEIGDFGATVSGVITSVENTCMKIIQAQANIRQSILLAQEICKLKPAALSDQAKELWSAVDGGIINIYKTALVLNKSSMDYFGFFFKFRQSFGHFMAAKDKSLVVSTENLQKDIKSFIKFSVKFEQHVASLSTEAMNCIESCVKSTIGAEEFEKVRKDGNIAQANYLKAQKMFNEYIEKLNLEHNTAFEEKTKLESEINTNVLILDALKQEQQYYIELRSNVENTKNKLLDTKSQI